MAIGTYPISLQDAIDRVGLRHEDLAQRVGVTRGAVTHWCNKVARPSGPARRQLALVLGVDLATVDGWFAAAPAPANANHPAAAAGAR